MQNKRRKQLQICAIFMAFAVSAMFFVACDDGTREFTIVFSANGGSGVAPSPITARAGSNVTLPSQGDLTRSGYAFMGWNTNAAGTGLTHGAGTSIAMPDGHITLYARWDHVPPLTGTVSITGNTWVGQTLVANIATLHGTGAISFQWNLAGTPIAGETGPNYVVRSADVGQTISVTVTRAGYSGSVTSTPVGPIATAAPAVVTWTANAVGDPTTTAINFTFSANPGTVQASDFTITPVTGSATAGTLTGSGLVRTLNVSSVSAGTVMVSIDFPGVSDAPQTVTLSAPAVITWTANAIGDPTTTAINFTFSANPGTMQASNFTITPVTGSATVGALTGSGVLRTLNISNVSAGSVMVSIYLAGVVDAPQTITLVAPAPDEITWSASPTGTPTTTAINFTFSGAPTGLVESDITITSGTGAAIRGALSGTGTTRTLTVSNVSAGTVSISINRAGIASGPQTVTLVAATPDVTWSATPTGTPTTTAINFTFSGAPTGLVESDITITSGTGAATGGALSGTGTTRTLTVSNVSAGTVSISINRAGIASGPQTVTLVAATPDVTWSATPTGTPTTTAINFTFSGNPAGLVASDITIASGTGAATGGALSGTGTTRTLTVSNVSAGTVSISINRAGIASGPQTVTLVAPTHVGGWCGCDDWDCDWEDDCDEFCVDGTGCGCHTCHCAGAALTWTANATGTPTTTAINFTFSGNPAGLVASDITIASGTGSATGGALTGTGTMRMLTVSNVSAGTVSISINRAGIASGPQEVTLVGLLPITITVTGIPAVHNGRHAWMDLLDWNEFFVAEGSGTITSNSLTVTFPDVSPGVHYIDIEIYSPWNWYWYGTLDLWNIVRGVNTIPFSAFGRLGHGALTAPLSGDLDSLERTRLERPRIRIRQ